MKLKVKDQIYNLLRGQAVKFAFKKIFGYAIAGPWGWVVSNIAVPLLDRLAKPVYDFLVRKGKIIVKKVTINRDTRRLQEAQNETDFDSAADDI